MSRRRTISVKKPSSQAMRLAWISVVLGILCWPTALMSALLFGITQLSQSMTTASHMIASIFFCGTSLLGTGSQIFFQNAAYKSFSKYDPNKVHRQDENTDIYGALGLVAFVLMAIGPLIAGLIFKSYFGYWGFLIAILLAVLINYLVKFVNSLFS